MEQTQARMLTVLGAVLLLTTSALWWSEAPEEPVDPEATAAVWEVSADAIERIRIQRPDDAVELARSGDVWQVEAPYAAEADPDHVEQVVRALEDVRRGVPVAPAGEAPAADFGLAPSGPVARVEVTLADGSTQTLVLGHPAPVGYRTYALGADGAIVAVNGRPADVLTEDASWYRDHRVFDARPEAVRRVTIVGPEGALSVHGEGARWWLDGWTRADPDRVDDLVMGLLDLRFDAFVDHDPDLTDPAFTVTLELEGAPAQRLLVGGQGPMGARVEANGREGVVYPEALTLLTQGPTDVGDPQAFPIDLERADAVVVTRGDQRWEAVRNGNEWRLDGEPSPEAHVAVERLADATIHYRREPVPPPSDTWATVEVREGEVTRTVDLGQVLDGWRIARDREGGEPYLVPIDELAVLDELPTPANGG